MNKKGLELPITAIVVLIIAILFLSLAGIFIRTLFTGGTEILTAELAKMREQLKKNLEESGELFVMSEGTEMEVKKGTPKKFYFGIRNTAPTSFCYRIAVKCIKPFTTGNQCSAATTAENVLVGGKDNAANVPAADDKWFSALLDEVSIPANDVSVSPVTLHVSGRVKPDTYLMEANVYKGNDEAKSCAETGWPQEATDTYQNKRFNIIVS